MNAIDLTQESIKYGADWSRVFANIKRHNGFNESKVAFVKITVQDYVLAEEMSQYRPSPASIVFGDYKILIDC